MMSDKELVIFLIIYVAVLIISAIIIKGIKKLKRRYHIESTKRCSNTK